MVPLRAAEGFYSGDRRAGAKKITGKLLLRAAVGD